VIVVEHPDIADVVCGTIRDGLVVQ